jgi:hypothetical protein
MSHVPRCISRLVKKCQKNSFVISEKTEIQALQGILHPRSHRRDVVGWFFDGLLGAEGIWLMRPHGDGGFGSDLPARMPVMGQWCTPDLFLGTASFSRICEPVRERGFHNEGYSLIDH